MCGSNMLRTSVITDLLHLILTSFASYVNKQRGSDRNWRVSVLDQFQQALTYVQSLIDSSLCGDCLTM